MGLFNRAPMWNPNDRQWILRQIGSALRDRLIADLRREEQKGYRTKRFLDGILSRHNHCKAYPKRLEIPDHLQQVSGYETIVRIAQNMGNRIISLTVHFPNDELHLDVHTANLCDEIQAAIENSLPSLGNIPPVRLTLL